MNERDLPTYFSSAIEDPVVYPHFLFEGTFLDADLDPVTLHLWTGLGQLSWDGEIWSGGGNLLGLSNLEESADTRAIGFSVSLSGQASSNISLALSSVQTSQGQEGKIWLALFTPEGLLLDEPLLLKRGLLDVALMQDAGDKCVITVQYEDRLIDLQRARQRSYTDQDQKRDYPTDRGFEAVAALQDTKIPWGRPSGI